MKEIEFEQTKNKFSMVCRVKANIDSTPGLIWKLLTDAKGFSRWNSTVTSIDGEIREGEQIRIHVPGTKRTFKPTVSDVEMYKRMTWSDGFAPLFKGTRIFFLTQQSADMTEFVMEEKFEGLVFAIIKSKLPDFKLIFERYATDLKNESERIYNCNRETHVQ